MGQCKHYEICRRDALNGEDLCILHSHNPEKDKKDFDTALDEHRNELGDCFSYFVFAHEISFSEEKFHRYACFDHVTFMQRVDFSEANFDVGVDFREAKFSKFAAFSKTNFKQANFSNAEFSEAADFSEAKFEEYSVFFAATFTKIAKFREAKFSSVSFILTKFEDRTSFSETSFKKTAWFRDAEFMAQPYFWNTTFAEADFTRTRFSEGAKFYGSTFNGNVQFHWAEFLGRTSFLPGEADRHSIPIFAGAITSFRYVAIAPLDVLAFRDADLKNCLFSGTDLRKVEFANVTWPQIISNKWRKIIRKTWPKIGSRSGVYDEIKAEEEGETDKYPHIEQRYRQLKQNYEDRKDYERASDFHYGEKEMRRRNPDTSRGLKFWLTLYWLISGYGERWVRPLIWAGGLFVVSTVLYLSLGLHPKNVGTALAWTSLWDWLRSAFYSFRVMTLLRPDDLAPIGYAKIVHAAESLLGPILIGLFALAVRQRLKR